MKKIKKVFITNIEFFNEFGIWHFYCYNGSDIKSICFVEEFMTREDEIAAKAVRLSTLKSLKVKKELRIKQIKQDAEEKIREVNIQYADDPERLRAKYAADDYARSEKARKRAEKKIVKEKARNERERKIRKYTLGEEIFSSIVQGIGACLFIAATALLNVLALDNVPEKTKVVYIVLFNCFGCGMILNYIFSVLNHAIPNSNAKEVFRRFTRIFILFVIESTYLVYSFAAVEAGTISWTYGIVVTGIATACAMVAMFLYAIAGSRFETANIVFNAVLGWGGLFICANLYHTIRKESFAMLIACGVFYTVGLVFCSIRKVKFMHAIGDLIVLAASVYLFFSYFLMY